MTGDGVRGWGQGDRGFTSSAPIRKKHLPVFLLSFPGFMNQARVIRLTLEFFWKEIRVTVILINNHSFFFGEGWRGW